MWTLLTQAIALAQSIYSPSDPAGLAVKHGEYTGPYAHGGAWAKAYEHAVDLVSQMTVEEKVSHPSIVNYDTDHAQVNLTSAITGPCQANSGGVPRLGLPGLCFNDGRKSGHPRRSSDLLTSVASGPRHTDFVTQFPSAFTAAASFDRDLIEERARAIGKEFRGKGINVELGPVTGGPLGRSPFAGRNWEGELYSSSNTHRV